MAYKSYKKGAKPLADLIQPALRPACRKRGFASADLLANWPDIVGQRYQGRVQPEKLNWPRRKSAEEDRFPEPAVLVVRTDGPTALMLQYETPQLLERINAFLGWSAVGRLKIIQRPLTEIQKRQGEPLRPLTDEEMQEIEHKVSGIDNGKLEKALLRLGTAVVARRRQN
ncbi:MAG: DciA family protein [Stappiaceae bacterium]